MNYLNINEINPNHNLYIILFFLDNNEKIIKFGYSDNIKRRMGDYLNNNPTIYILYTGYREDAKEFESHFHTNTISKYKREYYEFELYNYIINCIENKAKVNTKEMKELREKRDRERNDYSDYANHYKANKSWEDIHTNESWKQLIETCYKLTKKVLLNMGEAKSAVEIALATDNKIGLLIVKKFNVGTRYSRAEVKTILQTIYDTNGVNRKAKHSDLNEFFETVDKKVRGENYMEILKRK